MAKVKCPYITCMNNDKGECTRDNIKFIAKTLNSKGYQLLDCKDYVYDNLWVGRNYEGRKK